MSRVCYREAQVIPAFRSRGSSPESLPQPPTRSGTETEGRATSVAISVVVCTYSPARMRGLVDLLGALRSQTLLPAQIVVVVDHNPELLDRLHGSIANVTFVANSGARGLSSARNTGIEHAIGDVVAFIDDDAIPAPDLLERHAAGYRDPAVAGVGGAVDPAWETTSPRWFPSEFGWVVGCSYAGLPLTPSLVRNFIGCNMSFRRDVFDAVGGFLTGLGRVDALPAGCEETEFCIRLSRTYPSSKLLFDPSASVRHTVPAARGTWSYFRSRCYMEGRSKARVTRLVGASKALRSERSYVVKTLPGGVGKAVSQRFKGDGAGFARAAAIFAGLAITSAGYLVGTVELWTIRPSFAAADPVRSAKTPRPVLAQPLTETAEERSRA
jgi:O-antigen biosynthesis protein